MSPSIPAETRRRVVDAPLVIKHPDKKQHDMPRLLFVMGLIAIHSAFELINAPMLGDFARGSPPVFCLRRLSTYRVGLDACCGFQPSGSDADSWPFVC